MIPLYSGPGKIYTNNVALQPEGVNGPIHIGVTEDTAEIGAAMYGHISEQDVDQIVEITARPFDHWGLLRTLYPANLGITVGADAGALVIGTRPHGVVNVPTKVWTPDGRLYTAVRSAVIGHPTLHLGIGKALFDNVRIIGIGDSAVAMGAAGYLFNGNVITESAAPDPGGQMTMADFVRGAWTGVWGAVPGFGGAPSSLGETNAIQAEDEWTITVDARYSQLKVQGRTLGYKLDSVQVSARLRPFGPSHTDIVAQVGTHTQGQRLGSADLVLTGPGGKTITMKNCEVRGAGFEFGGTTLGTGEVAFVQELTFNAGQPQPTLIFSA